MPALRALALFLAAFPADVGYSGGLFDGPYVYFAPSSGADSQRFERCATTK